MDNVKDWQGPTPISFSRDGFVVTKELSVTNEDGEYYAVTDGKTIVKLVLVNPSPSKIASDEVTAIAAKPELDRMNAEFSATKLFSGSIGALHVMNDGEWGKLSGDGKIEHLRGVIVALLGDKSKANILLGVKG